MNNPAVTAAISVLAALIIGWNIFGATESPGTTLMVLQYGLLALAIVGLIGSLIRMMR